VSQEKLIYFIDMSDNYGYKKLYIKTVEIYSLCLKNEAYFFLMVKVIDGVVDF
jgi:hypothetical protein